MTVISGKIVDKDGETVVETPENLNPVTVPAKTYTINWVLNGGTWNGRPGETTVKEVVVDPNFILPARISEPDIPLRSNYVFQGWYTGGIFLTILLFFVI
jgi:hypothetical protein